MEIDVEVGRGDLVESVHRVAACAADARGHVLLNYGNPETPVYLRSAAKPIIAAAIVRAGAVERFGLTGEEIAIIAGSHLGTPVHVAAVDSILKKIGLGRYALQCGITAPGDEASAYAILRAGGSFEAIHNNCSGKHAGILSLALLSNPRTREKVSISHYWETSHPAQQTIVAMYERVFSMAKEDMIFGTDGCGIPVVALPMRRAAMGFARFAMLNELDDGDRKAMLTVRDAMRAYPEYVRGAGRFDTRLMEVSKGEIIAKGGAEGVLALGSLAGYGVVIKVLDGNVRAVAPAILTCLAELDSREDWQNTKAGMEFQATFATPSVRNAREEIVGEIRTALGKIPNAVG